MNRLQKKCVIATVGLHLLLLTILIFGPGFFNQQPKTDDTQVLDVIPAILVDAAINSGVANATPSPPTPTVTPLPPVPLPPQTMPTPPQPAPRVVEPPAPAPVPSAETLTEKLEALFRSLPAEPAPEAKPDQKPVKPQQNNIQISTQLVKRSATQNPPKTEKTDNADNQRAINNTLKSLSKKLSSSTKVDVPGTSSTSTANYKSALASIYYNAWTTPDNAASDLANTKVKITVAADGTVINSEIITPSGDAAADESVRQALERVTAVPPLPDQTKSQQEFIIDFNLKTKQMLE
jgi:TonB family protein